MNKQNELRSSNIFEEWYCEKSLMEHILRYKGAPKDDHESLIN